MAPDTTADGDDNVPVTDMFNDVVAPTVTGLAGEGAETTLKVGPPVGKKRTETVEGSKKGKEKKKKTYKAGDVVDGKILGYDGVWRLRRRIFPSPHRMPSAKVWSTSKKDADGGESTGK